VRHEVNLIDPLYYVIQVCSVHSSARCSDTAYKARLFSQHYNGQGGLIACSRWSADMMNLLYCLIFFIDTLMLCAD